PDTDPPPATLSANATSNAVVNLITPSFFEYPPPMVRRGPGRAEIPSTGRALDGDTGPALNDAPPSAKETNDERQAPPPHAPRRRPDAAGRPVGANGRGRRKRGVPASPLSRRHGAGALERRAGPPREEHRRG